MKDNKDTCEEYLDTLRVANEQWFYGYHVSREDYLKFVDAFKYFNNIQKELRKKLIKEGEL